MIFIFLSGKLLYFFLGLCNYWHYSDKFPKMFCSSAISVDNCYFARQNGYKMVYSDQPTT